ncbi:BTAD domain-containing putative transcriptional regulator [Actinoplanes couchii]|uniref:SARP family transcriptional regulator n=2 Tax=Actinoplanes couchii TaxID=403638 RepID=A0ABQ3XEG8_9ACTN|nr:SARP family transcriptional regulator [Actinoplanes couchii]
MRMSVLGLVRAWRGETELVLGQPRQRMLFAVLATAGRPVGRDEIIAAVWGANPPTTAAGSVHTYVSGLRRTLGRDRIVSGPAGYTLVVHPGELDRDEFDRLCEQAAHNDAPAAVSLLDRALGLWQGEAFAGLNGHWVEEERALLTERRLTAVVQRSRALTELNDDSAVAELGDLTGTHPLHEPLHEVLMLALIRAGRAGEAEQVFQRIRRALRAELGVDPGPALRGLHEHLQAGPRPAPVPVAAPAGRGAEIDRLRTLAGALTVGRGGSVWIEGEPGSGKSLLLDAAFADPGVRVVRVAGSENDEDALVPVLTRILGQLRESGAASSLILIVDDLQWTGACEILLLDQLVALTARLPLLVVTASRTAPANQDLARLRRGPVIRLGPLPADVLETLLAEIVGAPLGPRLATIVPLSGGNPRYARGLAIAQLLREVIEMRDGRADLPPAASIEPPRALLAEIRGTVEVLAEPVQEALRTAALLGPAFGVDDLMAVAGDTSLDLLDHLAEALTAGVVVEYGRKLAFHPPLLRQALYDGVPVAVRPVLHRHLAEVLTRAGSQATLVAGQLIAAAPIVDDWVLTWLSGNHEEVARHDPAVAADLIRQVLGSGLPDPATRQSLTVALVKAEFRRGRFPLAESEEAIRQATRVKERAGLRQLVASMADQHGDRATAIRVLEEGLADPDTPDVWRWRHRSYLARVRRGPLPDPDRAGTATVSATAAEQEHEAMIAWKTRWLTATVRRDHEQALAYVDSALELVRGSARNPTFVLDLYGRRMFTLHNLDRLDEAELSVREATRFAARHRLQSSTVLTAPVAIQQYWHGRWVDSLHDEGGGPLRHAVATLVAGHRGATDLARAHLEAAEAALATEAECECPDYLLAARSLVAEQRGRPEEALLLFGSLLEPGNAPLVVRHQWLPWVTRLALRVGRPDVARRAAAICAEEAERDPRPGRAAWASGRCRALLTGDPAPALAAAAHYQRVGRRPERAGALEDAAVLLAASRRPHDAARTGADSFALYGTFGASWDQGRLLRRLAEYGVEPPPAP